MTALSTVTLLQAFLVLAIAAPDDSIINVEVDCGKGAVEDAVIKITTDLGRVNSPACDDCIANGSLSAIATCAGLKKVKFTTKDFVIYELPVSYPGNGKQPCVFNKKINALVFSVKVSIAYGENSGLISTHEDERTVTCTFNPVSTDNSTTKRIVEGCIAPAELLSNKGPESKSILTLELLDVLGVSFTGRKISLGRTVQLRGTAKARDGEVGIRPVACYAIEGNASYAILRAGCGDGIVFKKNVGFTTKGQTTHSPYFGAFRINFKPTVIFRCRFVTCEKNCDGSSCKTERLRRSLVDASSSKCCDATKFRRNFSKNNLLDIINKLTETGPLALMHRLGENLNRAQGWLSKNGTAVGLYLDNSHAVDVQASKTFMIDPCDFQD